LTQRDDTEGRRRDVEDEEQRPIRARNTAALLREAMRAGDLPGHAGPGTLIALLPAATPEAAQGLAERLRREAATRLNHPAMDGRRLSVSLGIAPLGAGPARAVLDEAIAAAEAALAAAQAAGGERVIEAPAPPPRSVGRPA
jgi:GGDEF domain-containing protein